MKVNSEPSTQSHSWTSSLATMSMSTIGGAFLGGPTGAAVGLASAIIDEYAIDKDYVSKHYLSTGAFWSASVTLPAMRFATQFLPAPMKPMAHLAALATSVALPYIMDDFLNFKEKLAMPLDAFFMINQMFDRNNILSANELKAVAQLTIKNPKQAILRVQEDLKELANNPFLTNLLKSSTVNILRSISGSVFLYYLATYNSSLFIVNLLTHYPNISLLDLKTLSPFIVEAMTILTTLLIRDGVHFQLETIENNLNHDMYRIVLNKSTEVLINDGNGRRVLATEDGRELINNITPDLSKLLYRGASRLNYTLREFSDTLLSLNFIKNHQILTAYAPLIVAFQQLTSGLTQAITRTFKQLSEDDVEFWEVKFDIAHHIDQINLRDAEEFSQHRYNALLSRLNKQQSYLDYLEKVRSTAQQCSILLSKAVDVIVYGSLFIYKKLNLAQIPPIHLSVHKIYEFILSPQELKATSKELMLAKKRISKLFDIIHAPTTSQLKRTTNPENKIIIDQYDLTLDGTPLVSIPHLELEMPKRYAITGPSGCGKSSFLIDLKHGLLGNFTSKGHISLPMQGNKTNVMFIDQELYLPAQTTLFESICFPMILDDYSEQEAAKLREKVIALLHELKIDSSLESNDSENGIFNRLDSLSFKLSGGQKKKIGLIQAILRQPQVLIADEVLTGLDPESLKLCEEALVKYLPDTMILMVDHHAADNNHQINGQAFYDDNLHFEDGKVIQRELI